MENLKFKVSSALKNIIGKDLINDRYIAVFELVKNAYDSGATDVYIKLSDIYDANKAKIIIEDNGCGMTYDDLQNKWLFVAYSEKKNIGTRKEDYRNRIKRETAGAKGVGRFSCDRLGAKLRVLTKTVNENELNELIVDWDKFEENDEKEFMEINVEYGRKENLHSLEHGTILQITELREVWTRKEVLILKKSLLKLVNPEVKDHNIENSSDKFNIYIDCPEELQNDRNIKDNHDKINGLVNNDIFEKINIKTVCINVEISSNGKHLTTTLSDRGELIFKVTEENKYKLLENIKFTAFYLNRAAKSNFTRNMGVEPVNYGSIFIYKNGFRIYPYGEPGNDFFGVDKRKSQGYARYLGTRDMMGRIQVLGENKGLYETTSRDGGFVQTNTLKQLEECFTIKVHRVLEKYVVQIVDWVRPDKDTGKKELEPRDVIDDIINQAMSLQKKGDNVNIEYGRNIKSYIEEKEKSSLSSTINKVSQIAHETGDEKLIEAARKIKNTATSWQKQKAEDTKYIEKIENKLDKSNKEKELIVNQNFFLESAVDKKAEDLMTGIHLIYTYSESIKGNVKKLIKALNDQADNEKILKIITSISTANLKTNKLASYGIKGNFSLNTKKQKNDLYVFVKQYMDHINKSFLEINIINKSGDQMICFFDASIIGIIIDNIISNSEKAAASRLDILFVKEEKYINIEFVDDGRGIEESITDENILYEFGFTTTDGFGVGLHHIKKLVSHMKGKVYIDREYKKGFKIVVGVRL